MIIWSITNGPYSSVNQFDGERCRHATLNDLRSDRWHNDILQDLVDKNGWSYPTHVVYKEYNKSDGRSFSIDLSLIEIQTFLDKNKSLRSFEIVTSNEIPHHLALAFSAFYSQMRKDAFVISAGEEIDSSRFATASFLDNKLTDYSIPRWRVSPNSMTKWIGHTCSNIILPEQDTLDFSINYIDKVEAHAAQYTYSLDSDTREWIQSYVRNYNSIQRALPDYLMWKKNNYRAQRNPVKSNVNVTAQRKAIYSADQEKFHCHTVSLATSKNFRQVVRQEHDAIWEHGRNLILTGSRDYNRKIIRETFQELSNKRCHTSVQREFSHSAVTHGMGLWKALQLGWEPDPNAIYSFSTALKLGIRFKRSSEQQKPNVEAICETIRSGGIVLVHDLYNIKFLCDVVKNPDIKSKIYELSGMEDYEQLEFMLASEKIPDNIKPPFDMQLLHDSLDYPSLKHNAREILKEHLISNDGRTYLSTSIAEGSLLHAINKEYDDFITCINVKTPYRIFDVAKIKELFEDKVDMICLQ